MQTLTIDPSVPFLIPSDQPFSVVVVGAGGTGSITLQILARIEVHRRALGRSAATVMVIDDDTIEERNVGRQLFAPHEIGRNKAISLVHRLNGAFGLQWQAIPERATSTLLARMPSERAYRILVGCVDSTDGRRAMHAAIESNRSRLWLDAGNHATSGQILVGSVTDPKRLHGAFALDGIATALPAPTLVYPELLLPPPEVLEPQDCARAIATNDQALMVNQMMASILGQYLTALLVHRRLTTFQTEVDINTLSMRSTPITAAAVAAATQIPWINLTQTQKKGTRR